MNQNTVLLHVKDVSERMKVSHGTALKLFHRPDFPALRVGRYLLVTEEDFSAWLERQRLGGEQP